MSLGAHRISYRIGEHALLETLDLEVEVGEIVVIAGNNGAGKSTLLSLLAGCPQPSTGEVTLESRSLSDWSVLELATRRAVLPQTPSLAFDFPVSEMIALGAASHTVPSEVLKQRMHQVMEWMDLARFADRDLNRGCFSLSGGERQRVHIARVLLQIVLVPSSPRYLLLDEPLAALDLAHQYAVLERLRDLATCEAGVGVILITHDLSVALRYADRVCLLKDGRCYALGAAHDTITPANIRAVFDVDAVITKAGAVVTRALTPSSDDPPELAASESLS